MDLAEESLLAELIMSRRLDFGKNFRNRQARHGVSLKDEAEWMKNDAAALWLEKMENRALRKPDHRLSGQQAALSASMIVITRSVTEGSAGSGEW